MPAPAPATGCRAPPELWANAAARLEQHRRALRHVTLGPGRIGVIAQAALALDDARR